jgi:hypothetical protein
MPCRPRCKTLPSHNDFQMGLVMSPNERRREHYKRCKANGLCAYCGRHNDTLKVKCTSCAERANELRRKRRSQLKENGRCTECGELSNERVLCDSCSEAFNSDARERRELLKLAAFDAYGGRLCACCGESCMHFLSIDHLDGNGAKHRKQIGHHLYEWLRRNKYPPGFQVLCQNCNIGKHLNGNVCPHVEMRKHGETCTISTANANQL